jgi:hypothetical protein
MADLHLTATDREWLRAMELAMPAVPVVSVERYQAAVEAADLATRRNQVLRANQRRLWARYRRQRAWLLAFTLCSGITVGLGVWCLAEVWGW